MIISHKYKYLFVELPRTGSTAISKELCENYDGSQFLFKHATYSDFLRVANHEEKEYFVFSCIRNPLDDIVSLYFKYKTDHKERFTDPRKLKRARWLIKSIPLRRFNFVQKTNADFPTYFKRFYKIPYNNWSALAHKEFDYVIRFENMQDDFARVLELIGIEQKRRLPVVNKTGEKRDSFLSYYTPEIYEQAKRVCGPFMQEWGYDFPSEWGNASVSRLSLMEFHFFNIFRIFYWKNLRQHMLKA